MHLILNFGMSLSSQTLIIKDNDKRIFDIFDELIASVLRYTDVYMLERELWYTRLWNSILLWLNTTPSYVVNRAVQKYRIPLEQVLPFLNFCLKRMNHDLIQEGEEKVLIHEMLSLKNSLIIMNHFNKTSK